MKKLALVSLLAAFAGCGNVDSSDQGTVSQSQLVIPVIPTVRFTAERWEPYVDEAPVEGAPFLIDYDDARLPGCRVTSRNESWAIMMHYQFDSGPLEKMYVADPGMALARKLVHIPMDAQKLTVWFENYSARNSGRDVVCQFWDSVFGANYVFPITQLN
jgi:hypothetical protein